MRDTKRLKAFGPVIGVFLVGALVLYCLIGCSANESKPVESSVSSSTTAMVVQDVPESSSSIREGESSSDSSPMSVAETEVSFKSVSEESLSHEVSGFKALYQYPELPNGCEITSLAAVLNYYEFSISKTALSDDYLPKAPVGQANFYREFVGDPRDENAYGCYSPVIANTANSYLSSVGSDMRARDITGSMPDELYALIDKDKPVIVWATRYMEPGYYSVTWNVGGQNMTWYTPEHCLVLVGYDEESDTVQLADPMVGDVVEYDMSLFERRYAELKNQAVVIE